MGRQMELQHCAQCNTTKGCRCQIKPNASNQLHHAPDMAMTQPTEITRQTCYGFGQLKVIQRNVSNQLRMMRCKERCRCRCKPNASYKLRRMRLPWNIVETNLMRPTICIRCDTTNGKFNTTRLCRCQSKLDASDKLR